MGTPRLSWHIQKNKLSGVIPAALLARKRAGTLDFEYFENSQLCEYACQPPTALPAPIPLPASKSGSSMSTGAKIGVIGGVAIVAVLGVLLCVFIVWRNKKGTRNIETHQPAAKDRRHVELPPSQSSDSVLGRPEPKLSIKEFSFHQIMVATSNFKNHIGRGGFGDVFKAELDSQHIVAIKVASSFCAQQAKQFLNEVDILSKVHHKNLVEIVGYCNEEVLALVYQFMSNGSLFDWLHGKYAKVLPLSWSTRLSILVDAAQGLEYLHHGCERPIIHRDVKSSNILLNEEMKAKISDFGISRENFIDKTIASTTAMGTVGYMDPEYLYTMKMTRRVDVYSFGVLLFEVVCGRTPMFLDYSQQQIHLVDWAQKLIERGSMVKIVDETLLTEYHESSMSSVLEVARACVQIPSINRPDMTMVCHALKDVHEMLVS